MGKSMSIFDYNASAALNTTIASIPLPVGSTPRSSTSPAIRQIMADIKKFERTLRANSVCDPRYGAAVDSSTNDTAALNLATQATATASEALWGHVYIPSGVCDIGSSDTSIFVRKGQSLCGAGMGATVIDATNRFANTVATVVLGKKSDGTTDAGGQICEVSNLGFLGGASIYANVDATAPAGWVVRDVFFSAPGVGVRAGGGDGLIHGCIFDLGVNHIVSVGGNLKFTNNLFYLGNYHITVDQGSYDVLIADSQFEYFQYVAIQLQTGVTGLKNIQIRGCNFIQNVQYATSEAAISMRATGSDTVVQNCTFRNLYGSGIVVSNGTTDAVIENCVFNGDKTLAGYAQSTTMKGVSIPGGRRVIIRNCEFRNLPGQPVDLSGVDITDLIMIGCTFSGNTGGTTEVNISNVNASKVTMISCKGSGRALVNAFGSVQVKLINCDDGVTGIPSVASAAAMTLPKGKDFINVTGTTTITSIPCDAGDNGRVVVLLFAGALTFTDGGNLVMAGNFVTTADDTITLHCNGTNWYETGRSVN
jgi:hypothetical protein